ncbi:amino acid/amide ABC transporter membrane protein 1, HAAT family [Ruegeria halocynthiae]|uniref:Amino acid/amide ABC transporter membrane protein 1, HAAT family n=1 Tax=Ruegeria halocynthiae TaxID=985054 RepID=A0A1H3FWY0_9RHOB|nr:branched-chain amino acid ABC transporter permease [Ruegeria halocynthiae]SDX95420.1 amino acid/amide ABC transporter membrane protein 1, HAAT family [Ruegeria halocynthiae]
MELFFFQLLNGLGLGVIYFLLSVGLTITFGLLNFVNFAHGAFYMVGAYVTFVIVSLTGNFWLALLIAPLVIGTLAIALEQSVVKFSYVLEHKYQILVTLGVALMLQELVIMIWGPIGKNVSPPSSLAGIIEIGDFIYPKYRAFVIAFSALIAIVVWWGLEKTKFGALVRAGSENAQMVGLLGVNITRLFSITFGLGGLLAGLAGVLAAPLRGADPFMGVEALGIAFIVVVIGGMGSFLGALVGGLVVGVMQSVMSSVWPEGASLMVYAAMAAVILSRPRGLFGRA